MTARLLRLPPLLVAAVVLLAGAAIGLAAAPHVHRLDPFAVVVLCMAGTVAAAACLITVEPAMILTAGLLLSVFSGNWGNAGIHIPLDRIAIFGGIAATLLRSLLSDDIPRLKLRRVHWLMVLLILYAVGSAAWSGTLTGHGPLFALLDRLGLVPFLLYLIAPAAFATERDRRILVGGLVALGAYLGLITLFEAAGAGGLVVPHYIENSALGIHAERARGPFLEAGANGLAMFVCLVAAAIGLSSWRDRRARAAALMVMILCASGMLYTLTRQVWAGGVAGIVLAMLADRRLRAWLPLVAAAGAVIVVISLAFVPGLSTNVSQRASAQGPLWDRLNSDAAALRMIEARPALGFGWGTFGEASPPYYRLAKTYPLTSVSNAHNVPLSNAAELGLLGLALWIAILIGGIVIPAAKRGPPELERYRLGLIAIATAWFVQSNFTPFDYAFDNYVVWIFAGIVASATLLRRTTHLPVARPQREPRLPAVSAVP
ncbi:MAG TPA: O-antigen ligase family protein [Solirubrobacteraceae bacterium]